MVPRKKFSLGSIAFLLVVQTLRTSSWSLVPDFSSAVGSTFAGLIACSTVLKVSSTTGSTIYSVITVVYFGI